MGRVKAEKRGGYVKKTRLQGDVEREEEMRGAKGRAQMRGAVLHVSLLLRSFTHTFTLLYPLNASHTRDSPPGAALLKPRLPLPPSSQPLPVTGAV
jgi:hypothetical protein